MLRVVFDLSVAQVAEVMGRSEGAVRVLVHRGLSRLRELIVDQAAEADEKNVDEDVTQRVTPALT